MNHKRQHIILLALVLALLLGLSNTIVSAQGNGPSPGISYQGRVTVDGQAFDGTGYFMFAIVDSRGQLTWTSDLPVSAQSGMQLSAPVQPIALPVSRGLFSVRLGEFGLMNLIPSQALLDPQSSLRVWFSSNGGDFTQLPDRALAASTLRILRCNQLFPGGIDYPRVPWTPPPATRLANLLNHAAGPLAPLSRANPSDRQIAIQYWIVPFEGRTHLILKAFHDRDPSA